MTVTVKKTAHLTGKNFVKCMIAWFVFCTVFYVFIFIRERNRSEELIKKGISISKDISSQAGFPLLEKNMSLLSKFIKKISERPDVVFASIIDHKNKLIAYTDQEQFLALNRQKSDILDGVRYWAISAPNQRKIMTFSSEVMFSNTRIGEVCISIAAGDIGKLRRPFVFFSLLTLAAIFFVFGLFGTATYKDLFPRLNVLNSKLNSPVHPFLHDFEDYELSCPLCGNHENFSLNGFQSPDLDKFYVLEKYSKDKTSILLRDLGKIKELNWLNRLIIIQCSGIIHEIADGSK